MKLLKTLFAALLLCCGAAAYGASPRTVTNIDFDWYFHLGDLEDAEKPGTDYSSWRKLDVPHDWTIEAEYSQDNRRENAFLPGGIAWYKKEIEWRPEWEGRRVCIEFDAIYTNSTVWLNGRKIGNRPQGYQGINYDLTPYLVKGKNVMSVKVDNSLMPSSRWYQGAGIYRHVNLIVTDDIHVARFGTWVHTPEVSAEKASVAIETDVRNESGSPASVRVVSVVSDMNGVEVARSVSEGLIGWKQEFFRDTLTVFRPDLWSPDAPALYSLRTTVESGGRVVDEVVTPFGIRKLEFDAEFGFKLNGERLKMKGVCLHQNMGAAGSALTDDMWHRRLVQLKEMGCNAIRTSHYAYAPEFYRMCDEMGFMVVDEPWDGWFHWYGCHKAQYDYTIYFLDWWEQDLAEFIKRDRNHPSVVIWCIGNEVWGWERHHYLQWKIVDTFHKMDPTRPTVQAHTQKLYPDLAGFNADGENIGDIEKFRKEQPGKAAVGTEIPHNRQTRGVYRSVGSYNSWDKPDNFSPEEKAKLFPVESYTEEEVFPEFDSHYASSYDNQPRRVTHRKQWQRTRDFDFMIGEFLWTGFDYLGESWGWPGRTNNFGIIDLAGFPKDSYYLYQSMWSDKPMVHILPHWTWPGKEGVEIPVVVYTNGDDAELFYNGRSLGRKTIDRQEEMQAVWLVPYKAGTVTAVAYKDGREIARTSHRTASKPAAVKLSADRKTISTDKREVVYITADITDARGNFVPYADNHLTFEVTGPYKLIGVENGDIIDLSPHKVLDRKAFMGKALLILQATGEKGVLRVKAKSPALKSNTVTVQCD